METEAERVEFVEKHCDLPADWSVFAVDMGGVEVSKYDGETPVKGTIEILLGDRITEVVMTHEDMDFLKSARSGDIDPEDQIEVPAQTGVLRFNEPKSERAMAVVEELADSDKLREIAHI